MKFAPKSPAWVFRTNDYRVVQAVVVDSTEYDVRVYLADRSEVVVPMACCYADERDALRAAYTSARNSARAYAEQFQAARAGERAARNRLVDLGADPEPEPEAEESPYPPEFGDPVGQVWVGE